MYRCLVASMYLCVLCLINNTGVERRGTESEPVYCVDEINERSSGMYMTVKL